jgi:hypothetical protein
VTDNNNRVDTLKNVFRNKQVTTASEVLQNVKKGFQMRNKDLTGKQGCKPLSIFQAILGKNKHHI